MKVTDHPTSQAALRWCFQDFFSVGLWVVLLRWKLTYFQGSGRYGNEQGWEVLETGMNSRQQKSRSSSSWLITCGWVLVYISWSNTYSFSAWRTGAFHYKKAPYTPLTGHHLDLSKRCVLEVCLFLGSWGPFLPASSSQVGIWALLPFLSLFKRSLKYFFFF